MTGNQLATGYAPLLIQMYATAAFDFSQGDNGWLMAEFAFMRGLFLILVFPKIISLGRGFTARRTSSTTVTNGNVNGHASDGRFPNQPGHFHATAGEQADEEPIQTPESSSDRRDFVFDLIFLRWSLVVDGALTTVAAFATKRWHIYLGKSHLDHKKSNLKVSIPYSNLLIYFNSCLPSPIRLRFRTSSQRCHHRDVLRLSAS
jgi:hypothetical protein